MFLYVFYMIKNLTTKIAHKYSFIITSYINFKEIQFILRLTATVIFVFNFAVLVSMRH